MKTSLFLSGLVLVGLSLAGCAVDAQDGPADDEVSAEEAIKAGVAAGKFTLHEEPNHVADPKCDHYTSLELKKNGQAALANELTGKCALVAMFDPNPRSYTLRQTGTSCGSKVYEGSRRVALGPAKTGIVHIKITDHRTRVCKDLVPARIVVEEGTTKLYSQDRPASADITVEGKLFRSFGIGGENTGASIASKDGSFELVLDDGERNQFVDGRVARVKGQRTTLSGVETHDRAAIVVDEMLVCPASNAVINCMPGPARLSNFCGLENRGWAEANCGGVTFLD